MMIRFDLVPRPLTRLLYAALLGQGCLSAEPGTQTHAQVQLASAHTTNDCDVSTGSDDASGSPEGDSTAPVDDVGMPPVDVAVPTEDTGAPADDAGDPAADTEASEPPLPADPFAALSDEFDGPESLASWSQVSQTEQWPADQLESLTVEGGAMVVVPRASTWYGDWRGVLIYKEVTGDFIVDARVTASNRAGTGAPAATYSLAGLMLRAPRSVTPETWAPGGENHLFLSVGAAENAGEFRAETKTTTGSVSTLWTTPFPGDAQIRIARIGADVIQLIRPVGGTWTVHQRYYRPDFPATLQVGVISYTDWPTASSYAPYDHNMTDIEGGDPDLRGRFDWVRFAPAAVPEALAGASLQPPTVTDANLVSFLAAPLGDEVPEPEPQPEPQPEPEPSAMAPYSDEFEDATTLSSWQRLHDVEQWGADHAEVWDIDVTTAGAMTVIPRSSVWYQDYQGLLAFKPVTGDFVVETLVTATNRAGDAAPNSLYSLAGLMLRAPRDVTPPTWVPGGENYVFAALGTAGAPGQYVVEVKTTQNSVSLIETSPGAAQARVRIARLGGHVAILVAWPGQPFTVVRRYERNDLPATLQVGVAAYTDWLTACEYTPYEHNQTAISGGAPDLDARYDYVRFEEAPALGGTDPATLSDAQLIALVAP